MQYNPTMLDNTSTSPPFASTIDPVLTVATLNRLVRDCLEAAFPLTWIGGEISNLTYAASGHVYFTLKDAAAQVRCVMWRNRAQLLGWRLENGQRVEVRALVSFYEPRGEFQLNVETLRRAGQASLFERFLQLKAKLEAEGLFAAEGKRPLPAFPRRIGIVTSLQAAALRDVLSTLHRRAPHVALTLYPASVQGEGAAAQIAAALAIAAGDDNDLIILCRGGGSIEDLWAFNEEVVARAIRAAAIPVISGVGHETDFTIADFAADLRAPTPTAAAELAAPDQAALLARITQLGRQLKRGAGRMVAEQGQRLDWLAARLIHPAERLARRRADIQRLDDRLQTALARQTDSRRHRLLVAGNALHAARPRPAQHQESLSTAGLRLAHAMRQLFSERDGKLKTLAAGLTQLNPHAVLARGYALAIDKDGRAVRDVAALKPGDGMQLTFARGEARVTVDKVVAPGQAN